MNKYLEAEKRLAELLGYVPRYAHRPHTGEWVHAASQTLIGYQAWTRDNTAAFALMVEQSIQVEPKVNHVYAVSEPHVVAISYDDHPDKETAVRVAIVQAVINKLEQENKHET